MKVRVKICGVTTLDDARMALDAGVGALGLNFVPASPRCLKDHGLAREIAALAKSKGALAVGVFANASASVILHIVGEAGLDVVQLHGDEPLELAAALRAQEKPAFQFWKAFRVAISADLRAIETLAWPCDALLLDTRVTSGLLGGTGKTFDWSILDGFVRAKPLVLAGGLRPENVAEAVRRVKPEWVDSASGVESSPGRKDADKVRKFVESAWSVHV